ncbi:MAG: toprim domain-containing protein [Candidatus Woesearchaeota archaeon]
MSCAKEDLQLFLLKLDNSRKLIVVEGKKDERSLRELGISNAIVVLNKKPLYSVVEQVVALSKDVVILTDLDRTGRSLYSRLKKDLSERKVTVDNYFREFLFKNTKVRQIEGLSKYLKNLT